MFGRRSPRSSRSGRPTRGISERPRRRSPLDSQPARPRTRTSRAQQSQMSTMAGVRKAPRSAYQTALKAKKVMDPRKAGVKQLNAVNPDYTPVKGVPFPTPVNGVPFPQIPAKRMPRPEPIKETKTYTPRRRMPRPEPIKETKTYTPRVKRMSKGGMLTKNAKGHNDYRKTGTTLSVKDNRKNK